MFTRATKGQFSLRMLILVIVVMACGLAYLNWCRSRANREQAIVKRYGGVANYYFQYDEDDNTYDPKVEPPGPWFLRRVWGDLAFARVRKIYIENEALTCVDDLPELTGLKRVVIRNCKRLECIDGLANTRLRELYIGGCPLLKNVDSLANQKDLERFELFACHSLQNVDGLRGTNLKRFTLWHCPLVSDIDSLANQKDLERFELWGCDSIQNVDGLRGTNLKRFTLRKCPLVSDIDSLANQKDLKYFMLFGCHSLQNVDGLRGTNLKRFTLWNCPLVSDIDSLANQKDLEYCDLVECPGLENVDGLNEGVWPLLNVKEVHLIGTSNLQTLEGVDEASELEKLVLSRCRSLTSLKGLENSKADAVSIYRCAELSDISALDSMVNLKHVLIEDCPNVDLGEIAALQNKLQKRP